jgi:hypothetical protein
MENPVTLEAIQHEFEGLRNDVRQTNVRSLGLKVIVHEKWCQRMTIISDMLKQYADARQPALVPPAPPA